MLRKYGLQNKTLSMFVIEKLLVDKPNFYEKLIDNS